MPRVACAIPLSLLLFAIDLSASASDPVALAASLIGRPYVWGAEGPRSFDCSGLTQYVYGRHGIELPRRAISQSRAGSPAGRGLRRGDLLFFTSDPGGSLVTHVGIYEGSGTLIEASKRHGRVRRDSLDDAYLIERFLFARRVTGYTVAEIPDPAPRRRGPVDRHRIAERVLDHVADLLLRRPRPR